MYENYGDENFFELGRLVQQGAGCGCVLPRDVVDRVFLRDEVLREEDEIKAQEDFHRHYYDYCVKNCTA